MPPQQFSQQHDSLPCRNIREPHETCMAHTVQIDEIPEVLVQSHHHAAFHSGPFKQRSVPRVFANFPSI